MKVHFGVHTFKIRLKNCVLTIGNFDGLHKGHKKIFEIVKKYSRLSKKPSVALTFYPHPANVLKKSSRNRDINTLEERIALISHEKIDHLVIEPFTKELSRKKPHEFFNDILMKRFHPKFFILGHDFRFGRDRTGTIEVLKSLCRSDQKVIVVSPYKYRGVRVSSSEIRKHLGEGRVELVHKLLGRAFFISGIVVPGAQRGGLLQCPTANVSFGERFLPKDGVYMMQTEVSGKMYPSVGSVGHNETFGKNLAKTLEVHLLNFRKNIYNKRVIVHFLKRIRDMKKFRSAAELKNAIDDDIKKTRNFFLSS